MLDEREFNAVSQKFLRLLVRGLRKSTAHRCRECSADSSPLGGAAPPLYCLTPTSKHSALAEATPFPFFSRERAGDRVPTSATNVWLDQKVMRGKQGYFLG